MAIKSEKKVKKIHRSVHLADWITTMVDDVAIEKYGKRSDFMTSAMRNLLDTMITISHNVLLENLEIEAGYDFQLVRYYTRVNEEFDRLLDKYPKPKEKEENTSFSIYLTEEEDEWVRLFCKGNKRLKNIQRFARYAAFFELDHILTIEGYLIDLQEFLEKKKFDIESFNKELKRLDAESKKGE